MLSWVLCRLEGGALCLAHFGELDDWAAPGYGCAPGSEQIGMPRATFDEESFLHLWGIHGQDWTWGQYAEALDTTALALRTRVSRERGVWRELYGIDVQMKKTDTSPMFTAWPNTARQLRDVWLSRFLEFEAVVRERGEDALNAQARSRWLSTRAKLIESDQVIRYDPDKGFYRDPRLAHEPEGIIAEPRESYLNRHPDAREEG
jgi:hypothetical protein